MPAWGVKFWKLSSNTDLLVRMWESHFSLSSYVVSWHLVVPLGHIVSTARLASSLHMRGSFLHLEDSFWVNFLIHLAPLNLLVCTQYIVKSPQINCSWNKYILLTLNSFQTLTVPDISHILHNTLVSFSYFFH